MPPQGDMLPCLQFSCKTAKPERRANPLVKKEAEQNMSARMQGNMPGSLLVDDMLTGYCLCITQVLVSEQAGEKLTWSHMGWDHMACSQ